jgi:hypothetical protein
MFNINTHCLNLYVLNVKNKMTDYSLKIGYNYIYP